MLKLTTQLAAVTLTSDPLTLKLVHGVLVSQGPFLPSSVFVGLFVFPLGEGTGQTDRRTDGQDQHIMGHPSTKNGPIKSAVANTEPLPLLLHLLCSICCLTLSNVS